MKKNTVYILLLSLLGLFGLSISCTEPEHTPVPDGEENTPVLFNLSVPGVTPQAMTESQEETIETIDVLAFVYDGSDYHYSYRRQGQGYTSTNKSFKVDLLSSNSKQVLVVLVNARTELNAVNIPQSDNVESALAKIVFTSDSEWPAGNNGGGTGDFRAIPMTGISSPSIITRGMTEFPEIISLVRSLARINITLASGITNFELKTAQVYNRVTRGYVGYKPAEWTNGEAWVPLNGSGKPYKTYTPSFIYSAEGTGSASNISKKIYILESKGTAKDDYLQTTAVVVGGVYKPDAQTSITCYYRIDLTDNGRVSDLPVDIVRTNSYNIEIQKVENEGAMTAKDAYEGVVTLHAEVRQWEENTSGIIVDGQYYLRVSHTGFSFGNKGNKVKVTVETNYDADPYAGYPAGMHLDTSNLDTDWATVGNGGNTGSGDTYFYELELDVKDNPSATADRYCYFVVRAGNMSYQLGVYQGTQFWLNSNVAPSYVRGERSSLEVYTGGQWEISAVNDPDGILINGDDMVGRTGKGGDKIYFYLKSTAPNGKTATLTFTDRVSVNVPAYININTPG